MKRNSLDYLNNSTNSLNNTKKNISEEELYSNSLNNYKILEKIGEGMFSTVHLGEHILTGEKVAIKNLPRSKITSKIDKLRISREISILKKLHHFNIIKFYNLIETKESQFIIQEYCSGRELNEYIQIKQKLTEKEANKFFRQLISGLEYLAKNFIAHRDLKPENLLLSNNMNIKIIDFGLSNVYEKNKMLKTACGSPCFAAPEMLQGKDYYGLSVDLWAAGIILFFMVSGYLPFDDINNLNLYKKIIAGKIQYPKFFSGDLKSLLKKILEVNPKKRAKLKEIKDSKWFNLYNNNNNNENFNENNFNNENNLNSNENFNNSNENNFYSEGININEILIPIDDEILNKMKEFGFKKSKVAIDVMKNEYNNVTTTYYLLLNRKIKRKKESNSDLFSEKYKNYIKDEKNHLSYFNYNFDDAIKEKLKEIFQEEKIEEENKKKEELNVIKEEDEDLDDLKDDDLNSNYHNNNLNHPQDEEGITLVLYKLLERLQK
jgi:5'-AMP-activated protein kinase catalytic alpha subunit